MNAKRNASQLSPAKDTPQSKRHKKASQEPQGGTDQQSDRASSIPGNNNSSSTPTIATCLKCKDLKPEDQCLWIIQVIRQDVKGLDGVVLTCAAAKDRLPKVVRFHLLS